MRALTSRASLRIELQISELRYISNELQSQNQSLATTNQVQASQDVIGRSLLNMLATQARTERQLSERSAIHAASHINFVS